MKYAAAAVLLTALLFAHSVRALIKTAFVQSGRASAASALTDKESGGDAARATAVPTAVHTQPPVPTEDPEDAKLIMLAEEELAKRLNFDIGFDFDRTAPFAEAITDCGSELLALEEKWRAETEEAMREAVAKAAGACSEKAPESELDGGLPSWQLASALTWAFGRDRGEELLDKYCVPKARFEGETLVFTLETAGFDDIVSEGSGEERFTADFVYSYFRTVFNEDLSLKVNEEPALSVRYLDTIGFPLTYMFFYDTWYGPRQYSTRYHLGMDIHARRNSDIYSCTDGTVTMIGWDDTAGWYVVVEDGEGYEYHYYHMVCESDFLSVGQEVTRGMRIGSVGSTGNSDGNHLHLSIITPEHVHINPYIVMCRLRDLGMG